MGPRCKKKFEKFSIIYYDFILLSFGRLWVGGGHGVGRFSFGQNFWGGNQDFEEEPLAWIIDQSFCQISEIWEMSRENVTPHFRFVLKFPIVLSKSVNYKLSYISRPFHGGVESQFYSVPWQIQKRALVAGKMVGRSGAYRSLLLTQKITLRDSKINHFPRKNLKHFCATCEISHVSLCLLNVQRLTFGTKN